jgi:hypothetical protein
MTNFKVTILKEKKRSFSIYYEPNYVLFNTLNPFAIKIIIDCSKGWHLMAILK